VDVVVADARVGFPAPQVHHDTRGRIAKPASQRPVQQVAVGHRQVGIEHHDVGGDAVAVPGAHGAGP
jgi:hypothetical protein